MPGQGMLGCVGRAQHGGKAPYGRPVWSCEEVYTRRAAHRFLNTAQGVLLPSASPSVI